MRMFVACLLTLAAAVAVANDWAPGLPTGTPFPRIQAVDHTGVEQNFESLKGRNGLLFMFNRSSDW